MPAIPSKLHLRQRWNALAGRQQFAVVLMSIGGVLAALALVLGLFPQTAIPSPATQEGKLEAALSCMAGAGKVKVVITYETPEALADQSVLAPQATPTQRPIRGVIVVAQGANDLGVRAALQRAVQTALDLAPAQVDVFVME